MTPNNIVFIDSRVAGYQTLTANLGADTEWHLLTAGQDGVTQMQRVLANHAGLDSIQVISHGSTGALYLGNTVLNSANLVSYQSQLQSIGSSLSQTGDILLYGCNVAQGDIGISFVNSLARITGADVAASDDLTGQAAAGGDTVLETASGLIESQALSLGGLQQPLAANTAPTFSVGDGKLTTDFGLNDLASSIIEQSDGKLVIVGRADYGSSFGEDRYKFALTRYNANGTLDTTFDGDGKVTTNFGTHAIGTSIFQQINGKLLAVGWANGGLALARYNTNGTLDTTFDGDGKLTTYFDSYGVAVQQADGKLVVTGSNGGDLALARYNTDGSLDTTLDGDGMLSTDFGSSWDRGYSVIQQADGKLVVAGYNKSDFALARYKVNGTLDTSFSGDGKLTTDFSGSTDMAQCVIQQKDGKLVVAGYIYGNDIALARYNANGTLDISFSGDGKLTTDLGSAWDQVYSIIQQVDGKLVVAGYSGDSFDKFALARYNTDGTLDITFDGDGKMTTELGKSARGESIIQQTDGKLVVAGSASNSMGDNDFAVARYNLDGSLDTAFSPSENTINQVSTFTEGQSDKVILALNAHIFDAELSSAGHYGGASVTLSRHGGTNAQDLFGNTGTLSMLTEGSYFSIDSVTIGRVTTNSAGTLKLSFNSNATQSLVDKALQQIGYANSSDAPPSSVRIDWVFSDGNTGTQGTGNSTVKITPTNDAPVSNHLLQGQTTLASAPSSYELLTGAFSDPDLENLTYSVSMADDTGLPPWLSINPSTGTLSGTPEPFDTGSFRLRITARDAGGITASDTFTLTVITPSKVVKGSTANDRLTGQDGNDVLNGLAGNDTLDGGLGIDNMSGGDGSDVYYVRDTGDVVSETNAASAGGSDTIYSYLSSHTLSANVENGRIMAAGAANLTGNTLNNVIYASAGNNKLGGGAGTDTLSYAYGVTGTKGVTVSLAGTSAQATGGSGSDTLSGFENLTGSSNNDRLTGSSSSNILNGGAGTDALIGGAGDDTYYVDVAGDAITETSTGGKDLVLSSLLGTYVMGNYVEEGRINSTGAASLTGNGLANILYAGAGNNTLDGAADTDTASYQYGLVSGATAGVNVSLAITAAQATGRSGTDKLVNIENLTGSSRNDTLTGSAGKNILDGGSGNDSLSGGDGNDTLLGGAGKDTLVGGKGNDVFDFNALSEMGATRASWDLISGFVRGQDKIDLSTLDANTATTANDAFNGKLIAATAKFTAAGQLQLVSGILYGNTDGDFAAELAIELTGVNALSASDLVL